MSATQEKTLKKRIDRLKNENQKLREKMGALRKDHGSLKRDLKNSRKLIDNIPGAIILIRDWEVLFINKTSLARLGYTREEMHGGNFLDFVHPDSREEIAEQYKKRLSNKPAPDKYETYLVTKSGETLCCEVRVKKCMYHGRRTFVIHVVGLDRRKKKEKELIRSRKLEALHSMASGLNRELKSCLAILDAQFPFFEAIKYIGDQGLIRMAGKVEAAKEMGRHITDQLNCFSQTEYEPSDMAHADLRKAVRHAVSITRPKWDGNREGAKTTINVRTYLRSVSPVEAHPGDLHDALVSILLNAVDAMPRGGEIYITTEEVAGFAHVYIQDNGVGISEEIMDRIFDPFFTTHGAKRSGLGLSLADGIIKRHGGEIEVISQEGEGSTFDIKLPIAREVPTSRDASKKNRMRDSQILIIADEGIVKDLFSQLFKSKGGKVTTAFTGAEALKILRKKRFDLVAADMPALRMKPAIIIRKIKGIARGLPVVLIQSRKEKNPPKAFEHTGADLVIGLPLDLDRIPRLISRILSNRESIK
ncbi:MAG: PAS domain S-box protein [Deltaproteobacteria bacterium]|nr:PAS domain S-box protein [Deltaproteobacteria bacterium]